MGQTEYLLIIIIFNVFLLAFVVATVAFVIQYRNKKQENLANLQQQQILHQKELLSTQIEIQTQTMQHIGREIHDNVGQKLTLASLYAQQLAFENKALNINDKIAGIGEIINQSLTELRRLSKSLTDNHIETSDMKMLLKQEFDKIEELKQYEINLNIGIKELKLPYQTKSVILRVVQEFLQNSIKHAACKTLSASLTKFDNKLQLILCDDGKGFDVENNNSKGIGLINMKRRIELIGGSYLIQSNKKEGTKLTIEVVV
ncbi:MAG: ATP-binding protein [Bacteroidota bacterium]